MLRPARSATWAPARSLPVSEAPFTTGLSMMREISSWLTNRFV